MPGGAKTPDEARTPDELKALDGPAKNQEVRKRPEANLRRHVLSAAVLKQLEDTRTREMKAPHARAPSVATITEEM